MQCSFCVDFLETGLTVSVDVKSMLYGQFLGFSADLMLVDNFR